MVSIKPHEVVQSQVSILYQKIILRFQDFRCSATLLVNYQLGPQTHIYLKESQNILRLGLGYLQTYAALVDQTQNPILVLYTDLNEYIPKHIYIYATVYSGLSQGSCGP